MPESLVDESLVDAPDRSFIDFPFQASAGLAARARIGAVVLASDHTVEHEFWEMVAQPGVAVHFTRIASSAIITPTTLAAMEDTIASQAALILPDAQLDVLAYACTSASIVLGEDRVFGQIKKGRPEARPNTPITAAFAAFDSLDVCRIAVLTPYTRDVNELVRGYIEARGYTVPVFGSFNEPDDNIVACITTDSLRRAVLALGKRDDVDCVFVSCTSVRLADAIASLEAELGKPVLSSNQVLAWHSLRLAGIQDQLAQWGRLFTL
ncbi:maleate cis-trans isomerase family protein [Hwanghaeella sp. LZ110]|uniref:maleate cis-trans isomerase family protein n=1 Tax=Hwanghaeella sp. LZ110 TaxID=3402810 RepID=UPI003B67D1C8